MSIANDEMSLPKCDITSLKMKNTADFTSEVELFDSNTLDNWVDISDINDLEDEEDDKNLINNCEHNNLIDLPGVG